MLLNNIIDEKLGRAWQHKTCHTIDEHQRQTCQEKAASRPNQIPKIAIDMRGVELLLWLLVVKDFHCSVYPRATSKSSKTSSRGARITRMARVRRIGLIGG